MKMFRSFVAALVAALITLPTTAKADNEPAWFVPDATYEGVWKTVGANQAPDLVSQIAFGYKAADGGMILRNEAGKLAMRYGVNPVGAPNHTESNILVTQTDSGFRWEQGRKDTPIYAEINCSVSEDFAMLTCARHAWSNGREFFNEFSATLTNPGNPAG